MTGSWIALCARLVLRPASFATVASPAIADLQFEAAGAPRRRVLMAYFGACRAIASAALRDLRTDMGEAFAFSGLAGVWVRAILWYAGCLFFAHVSVGMSLQAFRLTPDQRLALSLDLVVSHLPLVVAGAAFGLSRRRPQAARSIAAAALVVSIGCFAIDGLRLALTVPAWAVLGAAVAMSRGWMVPVRIVLLAGGWFVLVATALTLSSGTVWPPEAQRWRSVGLLSVLAIVSWATTRARRHAAVAGLLTLLVPAASLAQTASVIEGRVVSDANGAALPRVRVMLNASQPGADPVLTDDQGRFVLPIPPLVTGDTVSFTAAKAGFASLTQTVNRRAPAPMTIRLPRGAAISGRVATDSGEPAVSALISVSPDSTASPPRLAETDDLGAFRVGGLLAGSYRVVVLGQQGAQREPIGRFMQRLRENPGLTVPAATTEPLAVSVAIGEERNVDILVPAAAPRTPPALPTNLPADQRGGASVSGRITSTAGRPLAGATVRLVRSGTIPRMGITDRDGRYRVADLPAGDFTVEASYPGHTTMQFGQPRANQPGKPVTVRADEEVSRIDIALIGGSAITGTVVDEHGEPIEGVTVGPLQLRAMGDFSAALPAAGVRPPLTDDRGQFRLWGLVPGRYIVSATADAGVGGLDPRGTIGYSPVYYPGTTDVGSATTVRVDAGVDLPGIDLTFVPARTFRVTGFALDAAGQPARGVYFFPSQRSTPILTEPRTTQATAEGAFTFTNVPAGEYVVQVMTQGAPAATGGTPTVHFGMQYVTVADADPSPITVRASVGSTIEGRIVADSGPVPSSVRVWPFPSDFDHSPIMGSGPAGLETLADGAFRVSGVSGPRRFVLMGAPENAYIRSAIVNGVDAVDVPFDFGAESKPVTDIRVNLGLDGASLTGRVTGDRGEPVPDYTVVAFATERELWYRNSQRLKAGRPNQEGTYRITGLPPGDYFVAAVVGLEGNQTGGEWQNPVVLEEISRRAQRITLSPSEALTMSPRLVVR